VAGEPLAVVRRDRVEDGGERASPPSTSYVVFLSIRVGGVGFEM